jgi:hypothetical protein
MNIEQKNACIRRFQRETTFAESMMLKMPSKMLRQMQQSATEAAQETDRLGVTEDEYADFQRGLDSEYHGRERHVSAMESCLIWMIHQQKQAARHMPTGNVACSEKGVCAECKKHRQASEEQRARFMHCQDIFTGGPMRMCRELKEMLAEAETT